MEFVSAFCRAIRLRTCHVLVCQKKVFFLRQNHCAELAFKSVAMCSLLEFEKLASTTFLIEEQECMRNVIVFYMQTARFRHFSRYVNLDDCWQDPLGRDATGRLQADPQRFPSGMLLGSAKLRRFCCDGKLDSPHSIGPFFPSHDSSLKNQGTACQRLCTREARKFGGFYRHVPVNMDVLCWCSQNDGGQRYEMTSKPAELCGT